MTLLQIGVASLHVLLGHLGAAAIHRLRFGRSPLVLYRARGSRHARVTRAVALLSVAWGVALLLPLPAVAAVPPALAWSLAAGGLLVMCVAQLSMGAAFRVGQDAADPPDALRTGGLHALSRNPIYVGSWTALAGMTLWSPSLPLVLLCLAIGVAMHLLVLEEERFLAERFGAAWQAYRRRVPRYVRWRR